jgi:two-component system chemotaxis response regulator CheY
MRALIVEDEFLGRKVLKGFLTPLFESDSVVNGREAVEAVELSLKEGRPYDLILMDIMMPELDGVEALERIRALERERRAAPAKVIMVTALDEPKTVIKSFHDGEASAYIVKPVDRDKLFAELVKLGVIGK